MEEGDGNPGMGSKAQVEEWGFHRIREGIRGKEGQEHPVADTCRYLKGKFRLDLLGLILCEVLNNVMWGGHLPAYVQKGASIPFWKGWQPVGNTKSFHYLSRLDVYCPHQGPIPFFSEECHLHDS